MDTWIVGYIHQPSNGLSNLNQVMHIFFFISYMFITSDQHQFLYINYIVFKYDSKNYVNGNINGK